MAARGGYNRECPSEANQAEEKGYEKAKREKVIRKRKGGRVSNVILQRHRLKSVVFRSNPELYC